MSTNYYDFPFYINYTGPFGQKYKDDNFDSNPVPIKELRRHIDANRIDHKIIDGKNIFTLLEDIDWYADTTQAIELIKNSIFDGNFHTIAIKPVLYNDLEKRYIHHNSGFIYNGLFRTSNFLGPEDGSASPLKSQMASSLEETPIIKNLGIVGHSEFNRAHSPNFDENVPLSEDDGTVNGTNPYIYKIDKETPWYFEAEKSGIVSNAEYIKMENCFCNLRIKSYSNDDVVIGFYAYGLCVPVHNGIFYNCYAYSQNTTNIALLGGTQPLFSSSSGGTRTLQIENCYFNGNELVYLCIGDVQIKGCFCLGTDSHLVNRFSKGSNIAKSEAVIDKCFVKKTENNKPLIGDINNIVSGSKIIVKNFYEK